jgi:hypothetical protein
LTIVKGSEPQLAVAMGLMRGIDGGSGLYPAAISALQPVGVHEPSMQLEPKMSPAQKKTLPHATG